MKLTIKEARYLVKGLEELISSIDLLAEIYAPTDKKEEIAEIVEKQSEGLLKLHRELSEYITKVECTTQIEFNFEDYL